MMLLNDDDTDDAKKDNDDGLKLWVRGVQLKRAARRGAGAHDECLASEE